MVQQTSNNMQSHRSSSPYPPLPNRGFSFLDFHRCSCVITWMYVLHAAIDPHLWNGRGNLFPLSMAWSWVMRWSVKESCVSSVKRKPIHDNETDLRASVEYIATTAVKPPHTGICSHPSFCPFSALFLNFLSWNGWSNAHGFDHLGIRIKSRIRIVGMSRCHDHWVASIVPPCNKVRV